MHQVHLPAQFKRSTLQLAARVRRRIFDSISHSIAAMRLIIYREILAIRDDAAVPKNVS
jgi:hypothetical protein